MIEESDKAKGEPLNEYDKTEWRDAARIFKPDMTDEEFEVLWVDFQAAKVEKCLS